MGSFLRRPAILGACMLALSVAVAITEPASAARDTDKGQPGASVDAGRQAAAGPGRKRPRAGEGSCEEGGRDVGRRRSERSRRDLRCVERVGGERELGGRKELSRRREPAEGWRQRGSASSRHRVPPQGLRLEPVRRPQHPLDRVERRSRFGLVPCAPSARRPHRRPARGPGIATGDERRVHGRRLPRERPGLADASFSALGSTHASGRRLGRRRARCGGRQRGTGCTPLYGPPGPADAPGGPRRCDRRGRGRPRHGPRGPGP